MGNIAQVRRSRLKQLGYDPKALTKLAGKSYSYWRDLMELDSKSFGERAARSIEDTLGLPAMWLDGVGDGTPTVKAPSEARHLGPLLAQYLDTLDAAIKPIAFQAAMGAIANAVLRAGPGATPERPDSE